MFGEIIQIIKVVIQNIGSLSSFLAIEITKKFYDF